MLKLQHGQEYEINRLAINNNIMLLEEKSRFALITKHNDQFN